VTREDQTIDPAGQSRYGLHKSLAEQLVRGGDAQWLVMRMGGFVGPGLKKNAIYDMLTGGTVWLSPQSELQFISTDRAADLVWQLVENGVRNQIINLGAVGMVNLGALHSRLASRSAFQPEAPTIRYEVALDKLTALSGAALPRSEDEVNAFVAAWKP
jgi:nucleoside-diphosphate-sugar epimerase